MPLIVPYLPAVTVGTLVTDAMYAARVLGQDETPSSADSQLVLRRLQRMLESWANERQMVYEQTAETFSTVAGQQSYSTSLLALGRPVAIESMRVTVGGVDYPVESIDQDGWNAIPIKTVASIPAFFFYDPTMDNGTIQFYPVPYAAMTVTLYAQRVLTGTLTLATNLSLPPGYEAAIVAGLAADIWPSFKQGDVPRALIADRTQTRAVLKRTNYRPTEMSNPLSQNTGMNDRYLTPPW